MMELNEKELTTTRELEFRTWSEAIDHADTAPSASDTLPRTSRDTHRYDFQRTHTFADAVRLATAGWPEGTAKATRLGDEIQSRLYNIIQLSTINYDVTGELLDVARFCADEPEHWGNWVYTLAEGQGTKYVHLVLSGFVSCAVSSDSLIARGVAVSSLVNMLELAGCRVKLTVVFALSGHSHSNQFNIIVPLKAFDEVLDLDRVTFALAHPAMFRRMIFSVMETLPFESIGKGIGAFNYYSSPGGTVKDKGDIYIPEMSSSDHQWETPESSVAWIIENLKEQGVLAKESN